MPCCLHFYFEWILSSHTLSTWGHLPGLLLTGVTHHRAMKLDHDLADLCLSSFLVGRLGDETHQAMACVWKADIICKEKAGVALSKVLMRPRGSSGSQACTLLASYCFCGPCPMDMGGPGGLTICILPTARPMTEASSFGACCGVSTPVQLLKLWSRSYDPHNLTTPTTIGQISAEI